MFPQDLITLAPFIAANLLIVILRLAEMSAMNYHKDWAFRGLTVFKRAYETSVVSPDFHVEQLVTSEDLKNHRVEAKAVSHTLYLMCIGILPAREDRQPEAWYFITGRLSVDVDTGVLSLSVRLSPSTAMTVLAGVVIIGWTAAHGGGLAALAFGAVAATGPFGLFWFLVRPRLLSLFAIAKDRYIEISSAQS